MNKKLIIRLLSSILIVEAAAMVPSLLVALYFGDGDAMSFIITMALLLVLGVPVYIFSKPQNANLRAREGFLVVPLAWLLLSLFGALPFVFSGMIPHFADALFESVSGFTTTGATIMTNVANQPRGMMFWRSFTHWIGGMGVLVLTLALLPKMSGRTSHLVKAESPGPTMSKLLPRMGDTAKVLYLLYGLMSAIMLVVLMLCGMNLYDACIHVMGTAGTGGFSNYAASIAGFNSPLIEWVIALFMLLFGVNFALYYKLLRGSWRDVKNNEELRWFLGLYTGLVLSIALIILPQHEGNFLTSLRYSAFQVSSIISTTGFATTDFNLWPVAAKMLIFFCMFLGGCAGSTAGGIKSVRVGLLVKQSLREIRRVFQPGKVQVVRFEGKAVEESVLHQVSVFFFVYIAITVLGAVVLSFNGLYDFETNFTAALTCVSNVGPGLGAVGPAGNFAGYSSFSKVFCSLLMLAGRLEILPILALFHPAIWRK